MRSLRIKVDQKSVVNAELYANTVKVIPGLQRFMAILVIGLLAAFINPLNAQSIYLGNNPLNQESCTCMNNSTNLTNGQFSELITVASGPGESWTVTAVSGLYSSLSPAPPVAPIPIGVGEPLPETGLGTGIYQLPAIHIDALGFTVTVSNGVDAPLSISNTCYYPNPSIINFPDEICLSSVPVTLEADEEGVDGAGYFLVDNVLAIEFDPFLLGVGPHSITYVFDAGEASPNDPTDPGCTSTVSMVVNVHDVPNTAVIGQVNVSLGHDCEVTVTPEMVLAGPYPCIDDYYIIIYDLEGQPIGDVLTGEYLGQLLPVQVLTYSNNYTGTGLIHLILGFEPDLECPENASTATVEDEVYLIEDEIEPTDPTVVPLNFACYADLVSGPGIHNFHLDTFTVDQSGIYVFEGVGEFGKLSGLIYEMEFNPGNGPCNNVMASSQDIPLGEGYYSNEPDAVRINVQLHAGTQYILFTFGHDPGQTGDYEWVVWDLEGDGAVVGLDPELAILELPLFCKNYEDVLNNPESLEYFGYPDASANCQPVEILFNDVLQMNGDCEPATIVRTFSGTNIFNNALVCTQEIEFDYIEFDDLTLPPQTFTLECDETYALNDEGNPHPTVTGYPYVLTAYGAKRLDPIYCNFVADYDDQERVYFCENNYQFIRRWLIIDNCISEVYTFNQFIRVGDFTGPEVSCSAPDNDMDGLPDTLYYSSTPLDCSAIINVPLPEVSDNCSSTWTIFTEVLVEQEVPVYNNIGLIIGVDTITVVVATIEDDAPNRIVTDIPEGCHRFRYTVTDDCGNSTVIECPFCVADEINPVAVCDDDLNLSIGGDGYGRLYAEDVDEGSNDNCGILLLEVRRMITEDENCNPIADPYFTPWAPFVEFSCCDVGTSVEVELRVTDLSGNTNVCSTGVMIEDESDPFCVAPDDVTTTCAVIPYTYNGSDLTLLQENFGMPVGVDNCLIQEIVELAPIIDLDDCGYGTIIRQFQVIDQFGNVSPNICEQEITVTITKDYLIKFPKDHVTECAVPLPDTLEIFSNGCEALTVQVSDAVYSVPNGACYKILRTYDVIDWCEYDGSADPVILRRDEDCDATLGEEDLWLIRRDGQAYTDRTNNENDGIPTMGTKGVGCDGTTNPSGYWRTVLSNGRWQYTQVIMVNDITPPQATFATPEAYCSYSNDCTGEVAQNFVVSEICSSEGLTIEVFLDLNNDGPLDNDNITDEALSGSYPNYVINGVYPLGDHAFDVHIEDGCGNLNIVKIPFSVVDCFAPTPICIHGLSTSLEQLPGGIDIDGDGDNDAAAKVLLAETYVVGPGLDDCHGPTTYSIHLVDNINDGTDIPEPSDISTVVTCDELGETLVRIYSWDNAYNPYAVQPDGSIGGPNYDYCETFIDVQDNQSHCTTITVNMGAIAGHIMTEENQPVQGVELGFNISMPGDMMTDQSGGYMIDSLELGGQYTLVPQMDYDYGNGVSTLDVIQIAKHILGTAALDSPYKIIAADINRSGSVSTIDMIQLRKLILGVIDEFPDNTSWRFVKAAHEFPNPADPWETLFPETLSISQLDGNAFDMDFVAVKIGDVNNSAVTSFNEIEERNVNGTFYVEVANDELRPGQEYRIDFNVGEDMDVQGMQFTMEFDREALELLYIENGVADDNNFGFQLAERGVITFSWEHPAGDIIEPGTNLFSLVFFAGTSSRISDHLTISSDVTMAEAYGEDYELYDVDLLFKDRDAEASGFELYQNIPNPFRNRTTIPFMLPEASMAMLTIYDVSGRIWKRIEGHYESGHNQIHIDLSGLPIKGVLYYKLETSQYTATRKMILID